MATTVNGAEIPPGITQVDGEPPYAQVMAQALSLEARQRGANLLLAAGDISSEASQIDVNDAKSYLDAFGLYGAEYFVTRGNHDRPHNTGAASPCSPVPSAPGYFDCFRDAFFPAGPTWFSARMNGLRVIGLDTYDKIGNGGDNGVMRSRSCRLCNTESTSTPKSIRHATSSMPMRVSFASVARQVSGVPNRPQSWKPYTPERPGSSSTTPGTPTGTSGRCRRPLPASCSKRSPP